MYCEDLKCAELLPCAVHSKVRTVVIVDPLSTGAALAAEFVGRVNLIRVWACQSEKLRLFVAAKFKHVVFSHTFVFNNEEPVFADAVSQLADQIKNLNLDVAACIAGAECGVEVAEMLAQMLGLPSNDPARSAQRRDKFFMGEAVRQAGVRAVAQRKCATWQEVQDFVEQTAFDPFEYIIKPINSGGSDNVFLCHSLAELKHGFDAIVDKVNVLGIVESACLVQEFITGSEYVVDTVSRHGVHRTVAIWEYDKRPCNGREFIYFGMRMVSGALPMAKVLCDYVYKVLDAVGIVNSSGHAEVKLTPTGPCLIEVGARPHGGEGLFVSMAEYCVGYSQLSAIRQSVLDEKSFTALPSLPVMQNYCVEAIMVVRKAGILKDIPNWHLVERLPSYHSRSVDVASGDFLAITTNLLTSPGSVIFLNADREQLERDFEAFRAIEVDNFYVLEDAPSAIDPDFRGHTTPSLQSRSMPYASPRLARMLSPGSPTPFRSSAGALPSPLSIQSPSSMPTLDLALHSS